MTTPTTTIDPKQFLVQAHGLDPLAAVRLALKWCGLTSTTPDEYQAAWHIMTIQTVVPRCDYCDWAILNDERHEYCEQMMGNSKDTSEDEQDDAYADQLNDDDFVDSCSDGEDVPMFQEVYGHARAHFGNDELAHEAASQYPGDFI